MQGRLWHDNDPEKTLKQKLEDAVAAYRKQWDKQKEDKPYLPPDVIYVNPITVGTEILPTLPGIEIVLKVNIRVNDFLVGRRDV